MSDQQPQEIRYCLTCGRELTDWHKKFCDDDCYAAYPGPPASPPLPAEPAPQPVKEPVRIEPASEPQPVTAGPKPPKRKAAHRASPDVLPDSISELADRVMADQQPAEAKRKTCSTCGKHKPLTEFYPDSRLPDGHRGVCKACLRKRSRDLQRHPELKKPEGAPTKRSDEKLAAIFSDMAQYNMTEEQACEGNGVSVSTFNRWKNSPDCEGLRARAQFYQIKRLIHKQETEPDDWRRWKWRLEVTFRQQFGEPAKIGVQVNQQFNGAGGNLHINQEQLEEVRQRLDQCKLMEQKRKAGVATNAELREYFTQKRDEFQHLIDCLDDGMTPDQQEQQRLYRLHEEQSNDQREPAPIRTVEGSVVGGNNRAPLAIEGEPERSAPPPQGTSMRAGEIDPLSGQPIRQGDRPIIGPLSARQRWLAEEKARMGGEGKTPW